MGHADRIAALPGSACQAVVAGISIELQRAVEAVQELLGILPASIGRIEEDYAGWIVTAPAPIVAREGPQVARFRPAPAPGPAPVLWSRP